MYTGKHAHRSEKNRDDRNLSAYRDPVSDLYMYGQDDPEWESEPDLRTVLSEWAAQLDMEPIPGDPDRDAEPSVQREEVTHGVEEKNPTEDPAITGKKPGNTLLVSDVIEIIRNELIKRSGGRGSREQNWIQRFSEPENKDWEPASSREMAAFLAENGRQCLRQFRRRLQGERINENGESDSARSPEEEKAFREENRIARQREEKKARSLKKKVRRGIRNAIAALLLISTMLGIGYTLFVFSDIPFFVKWRTLYIETAMSTLSHQWLATSFIPGYIIDDVMNTAEKANEDQKQVQANWAESQSEEKDDGLTDREYFYETYWELNEDLFEEYLDQHPEYRAMGYRNLVIDNLDCQDTELHTRYGEVIRAINVPDNVIINQVKGTDYVGTLATVKDPGQVTMKKAENFGSEGDLIETFCKDEVLAINGSGFLDEGGLSNGSTVVGSFVLDGTDYGTPDYNYLFFGMREDNRLNIQWGVSEIERYRWAFQFSPALIINGKTVVEGSYGWGLQPRSAIGQTRNGDFLMLIVDGRQVGYSIGCLVEDCAKIMQKHRAYQAVNMDGGSSSIMAYEGSIITRNSSKSENGREIPNAIVVQHPEGWNSGSSENEESER